MTDGNYREFEPTTKLEITVPKIGLISDTNCRFGGSPKLPSGLIIHYKDSQNLLTAIMVIVIVYYREGEGVKSAKGRSA